MGCYLRAETANGKDSHERVYSRWPNRPVHSGRHALYRSYDRSPWHRRGTGGNRVLHARRVRARRCGGGCSRAREDGCARHLVASFGRAARCGRVVPSRGGHGGGAAYGVEGVAQPVRPPVGRSDQDARDRGRGAQREPCMRGAHYAQKHAGRERPAHESGHLRRRLPTPFGRVRDRARVRPPHHLHGRLRGVLGRASRPSWPLRGEEAVRGGGTRRGAPSRGSGR